ncbi:FtsX-like permease family protein [Streptomyces sp. NBC_00525]|uniref:FtsX-like permease family protein n=1 Tax=Streptomyces sp. NBC_00525 TaxID=2903660 RepID=UPI002E813982|nr:FtsX-like permease family protein [Streptomyces sp. NBC_00525]WUC93672.1 FtsX-like permease family protein [Streptomyces sp. NBC_00525]
MTGFVFLRVRAHRLLLAAAVLAVLLTTSVLAALTAFSGSVGDAALRHTLTHRSAEPASLVISAQLRPEEREPADAAARKAARETFDGLPVTVRTLEASGPYALPRSLQSPAARRGDPDLTHFAALDRSRVRVTAGRLPAAGAGGSGGPVEVALPATAAEALSVKPGARFEVTDRLGGKPLDIVITGFYKAADQADPYWQLDALGGRGIRKVVFTTYGPLLADPALLGSGRTSAGETAWLATADFRTVTTDAMADLREAATAGPERLLAAPEFKDGATARTSLPTVLEEIDRALLVSRSTLTIVAVQLVLLAGYALLLVARLLSSERAGETELLRARGGSRARITSLAAVEALLLALPAAVVAPLLSGPLTRLLADRSELSRIGLRLDTGMTGQMWLVAAVTALACALAVVAPALAASAGGRRSTRSAALPGPVRAGADLALLLIAAVAYWQLDRQTKGSGGGALSGDRSGGLGIDPLLVAAPALLLLAGTVLTLRLLPPAARLAERRAAGGRGLATALAGWQFSRRPLRGAGPVLLLVLSAAMGMLAIGQSASWNRSQSDQADFRSGASVRMTGGINADPAKSGAYEELPGVRGVAPAFRTTVDLSGERTADVLALDTAHADERMLMRDDLGAGSTDRLFDSLAPAKPARPGLVLPAGSTRLRFDLAVSAPAAPHNTSPSGRDPRLTVLLEDRYGLPYQVSAGQVPVDGKARPYEIKVSAAGGLAVTGFELDDKQPVDRGETHRLTLTGLRAVTGGGAERPVPVPGGFRWRAAVTTDTFGEVRPGAAAFPTSSAAAPLAVEYRTGSVTSEDAVYAVPGLNVRITAERPKAPAVIRGVATDAYLRATGARTGQAVDVTLAGERVRVKIARTVDRLPTTGPGGSAATTTEYRRARDGGALLLDLRSLGQVFAERPNARLTVSEWWMSTEPGRTADVAAALRALPDVDPAQVLVRDEVADELVSDPLGAGPQSALLAVAVIAAALAAVGFAVAAVGSQRERSAEFAVLRALGTPRRQLARMTAAEQGVLIAIALLVGGLLGALLTRAVVPLIVLTGQAAQPVPPVLVQLPAGQVALLLAGVAALPLLIVAALALRRADPAISLRHQGDH